MAEPEAEAVADGELEEEQSDWVDFESVFEDCDCCTPLKIQKEVVDQCYHKASSLFRSSRSHLTYNFRLTQIVVI